MSYRSFNCLAPLLLLLAAHLSVGYAKCGDFPSPDPCSPGGVWDPVLKRCTGLNTAPCYQCYHGEHCSQKDDPLKCQLSASSGNPAYLAEYWTGGHSTAGEPCTMTAQHYRPGYQYSHNPPGVGENIMAPLREAIVELHTVTGNTETDGYSIVTGMGATMVLYTAVTAIAQRILEECSLKSECQVFTVELFAQAPYYYGYLEMAPYIPNVRWNATADPSSPYTIEILTFPNNPSGEKREPLVKDPSRVIYDMVYYWPMYTQINTKLSHQIMVFSSSKHGALAGTRFGWALVKDQDVFQRMINASSAIMISYSVDSQLRVLNGLMVMLAERNKTNSNTIPFQDFGQKLMSSRFQQLFGSMVSCPGVYLVNPLNSTGGYAWILCDSALSPCDSFLKKKVNLLGINGEEFGVTNDYVRLDMLLPTVEFDTLLTKIKALCSMLRK